MTTREKVLGIIACVLIMALVVSILTRAKYQSETGRISELDRQYSESDREARRLLGHIGDGLIDIQGRLATINDSLRVDASDLRSVAAGIRAAAEEVREMEDIIVQLNGYLSGFIDYYYDTLDAEIERELGITIPGR